MNEKWIYSLTISAMVATVGMVIALVMKNNRRSHEYVKALNEFCVMIQIVYLTFLASLFMIVDQPQHNFWTFLVFFSACISTVGYVVGLRVIYNQDEKIAKLHCANKRTCAVGLKWRQIIHFCWLNVFFIAVPLILIIIVACLEKKDFSVDSKTMIVNLIKDISPWGFGGVGVAFLTNYFFFRKEISKENIKELYVPIVTLSEKIERSIAEGVIEPSHLTNEGNELTKFCERGSLARLPIDACALIEQFKQIYIKYPNIYSEIRKNVYDRFCSEFNVSDERFMPNGGRVIDAIISYLITNKKELLGDPIALVRSELNPSWKGGKSRALDFHDAINNVWPYFGSQIGGGDIASDAKAIDTLKEGLESIGGMKVYSDLRSYLTEMSNTLKELRDILEPRIKSLR